MTLLGNLGQAPVGVQGTRPAHDLEQGHVLVAVRIKEALGQVQIVLSRQLAARFGLALAPAGGVNDPASKHAVLDIQPGAEHVGDVHLLGQGLGLVTGGRRDNGHGVPHRLVGLHQGPGFGIDLGGQVLGKNLFADLEQDFLSQATIGPSGGHHHAREARPPQAKAQGAAQGIDHLLGRHASGQQPLKKERRRRKARQQRAIEIEERPDFGTRRPLLDLFCQALMKAQGAPLFGRAILPVNSIAYPSSLLQDVSFITFLEL